MPPICQGLYDNLYNIPSLCKSCITSGKITPNRTQRTLIFYYHCQLEGLSMEYKHCIQAIHGYGSATVTRGLGLGASISSGRQIDGTALE